MCEFCQNHEQGDTLYEPSDWDGGIGFDYIRDIKYCPLCGKKLNSEDEPTISKVDKDINVRSKDEPQTCDNCKLKGTTKWCNNKEVCRAYKPKDEPQTCSVNGRPYSECSSCERFRCTADEPQTDVYDYKGKGKWERSE